MRFILLIILTLVFGIGCGQSNPPRNPALTVATSQPVVTPPAEPAPATQTQETNQSQNPNQKSETAAVNPEAGSSNTAAAGTGTAGAAAGAAAGATAGNNPSPSAPVVTEQNAQNVPQDVAAYEQQIGFQENILYQEEAALEKAIAEKNKDVHLGANFMKTVAYGLSSGFLSWDFLKRINVVENSGWDYLKKMSPFRKKIEVMMPEETAMAKTSALRDTGSVALATTEFVSAAVLGILAVNSAVALNKDRVITFSSTDEIRMHDAKVREARRNLRIAQANLRAVYFPPNPAH